MNKLSIRILCSSAAILVAAPAMAASADYYLIIDGVPGEASVAAKVSSWSFGASNPQPVSGRRERPTIQASQNSQSLRETATPAAAGVVGPREASSGMASGKRTVRPAGDCDDTDSTCRAGPQVAVGDVNGDGTLDFAEAGRLDQVGPLSLIVPTGSDLAKSVCGDTSHLRTGHIVRSDGTVYDLSDLRVTCDSGSGATTIALSGSMKTKEFKGHVTLLK